ncbi:neurotrophin-4 [Protopterus annectens]|uniref:neurotrophin-4 n=1 Tax=Protopterus annectens TaxID=7888 RepID=UPI001CFB6150|nr:neurotrophin-4 [Protopterus annectens]
MIILLYAMVISHICAINAAPFQTGTTGKDQGQRQPHQAQQNTTVAAEDRQEELHAYMNFLSSTQIPEVRNIDTTILGTEWDLYSPRVSLTNETPSGPPLLFLMEEHISHQEVANRTLRAKRADNSDYIDPVRRGELSVCDSISAWVMDKVTAVDSYGKTVNVLTEVQTPKGPLRQYFYETNCHQSKSTISGCRGVDKRQWISECKPKQSYVRALTVDNEKKVGWRWIRINTACVCVLVQRTGRT